MANPYHSAATSLVRSLWPGQTSMDRGVSQGRPQRRASALKVAVQGFEGRVIIPPWAVFIGRLGYRSRHVALPKPQERRSQGKLVNRCPDLNLYDLQNYVGRAGQEHHEKRKHHCDQKPRQPEGPPPNVASSSSGDNPVNLGRIDDSWYHSDGKHLEATQVEPSPPSEAATGHAVSTKVWLTLLLLPAISALCPLNEVVRLACTSRMALEPTVAGHLAFIQHLWRMLSRRPTNSTGRHHRETCRPQLAT